MKTKLLAVLLITIFASASFAGQKAPDFTLENLKGEKVSLTSLKGKVVIIDFWATWCPPCRKEIPHFNELYAAYKSKGVEILGVSLDRDAKKTLQEFLKSTQVNYPILIGNNSIAETYQQYVNANERGGIPFTFILDKKGEIAEVFVGYREKADFEKVITKLLQK